ncbi:hypothetical protein B0H14DRAFT_3176061 [Mycena olivaceomarginata]|nr:hypothetical protein B0H14DRAFT_3176061 [Mycena olivaceomarginata]
MWQNYDKYDAGFSAGDQISEDDIQRKMEQEMDMMGIWDAVELGHQLDGELDNVRNPASEDDALLAEVLQALDADPFDATEAQNDSEKSTEWYPYTSKTECSNVEIRSQFHLYPEINTTGSVTEIWHGEKLCKEINPELLTPMFDAGNGVHYYVNEVAQLTDGRFVIPFRWIKVDELMHADSILQTYYHLNVLPTIGIKHMYGEEKLKTEVTLVLMGFLHTKHTRPGSLINLKAFGETGGVSEEG